MTQIAIPVYRHGRGEDRDWDAVSMYDYPYAKTYDFPGAWIDADHERLANAPYIRGHLQWDVEGWLTKGDALKLYELAYFAGGPILEIGAGWGLSTTILATAAIRSGNAHGVETIESAPERADYVTRRMTGWNLPVHVRRGRSDEVLPTIPRRSARLIFVDGGHAYADCAADCRQVLEILAPGGFALFHDFTVPENADPANAHFGVWRAVANTIVGRLEFWGCFGISGLFRRGISTCDHARSASSPNECVDFVLGPADFF